MVKGKRNGTLQTMLDGSLVVLQTAMSATTIRRTIPSPWAICLGIWNTVVCESLGRIDCGRVDCGRFRCRGIECGRIDYGRIAYGR